MPIPQVEIPVQQITQLGAKRKHDDIVETLEEQSSDSDEEDDQIPVTSYYGDREEPSDTSTNYSFTDISSENLTTSIYEKAIKQIDIDSENSLRQVITSEFRDKINKNRFNEEYMRDSQYCKGIIKYIFTKVSPHISKSTKADISITTGMTIPSIREKLIKNENFFNELEEFCKKTAEELNEYPRESFLNAVPRNINFGNKNNLSTNIRKIYKHRRENICEEVKLLIVETIKDLPNRIKKVIEEKFEAKDILKNAFAHIHGVYVTKAFAKSLVNDYSIDKLSPTENKCLKIEESVIRKKLKENFEAYPIFSNGKTVQPNKTTVKIITRYLISDICKIYSKKGYRVNIESTSTYESTPPVGLKRQCIYTTEQINTESPSTSNSQHASPKKSSIIIEQCDFQGNRISNSMSEELSLVLKPYKFTPISSDILNRSVYEEALDVIDVDEEKLLKDVIVNEFGDTMIRISTTESWDKSSIRLSTTYGKIRQYISNKVSPYIKNSMLIADLPVIPKNYVSDIKNDHMLNETFFNELQKCCKTIETELAELTDSFFLDMLQPRVYFNAKRYLDIDLEEISKETSDKLSKTIRQLTLDTVRNLSLKIKSRVIEFPLQIFKKSVFVNLHGITVTKSFVRDLINFYDVEKMTLGTKTIDDNQQIIEEKIKCNFLKSVVLIKDRALHPNKRLAKSISKYLLLDMKNYMALTSGSCSITSEHRPTSSTSSNKNILQEYKTIFENCGEIYPDIASLVESYISLSEQLPSVTSETSEEIMSPMEQEDNSQSWMEHVMPERLKITLREYHNYTNIYSEKLSTSIYRSIAKTIDFDTKNKKLFETTMLGLIYCKVNNNNLNPLNASFSESYDKIHKYIFDRSTACFNQIKSTEDIAIHPGMSASDIKDRCIRNKDFFCKLRELCKVEAEAICNTPDENFLSLFQTRVNFGANEQLRIDVKRFTAKRKNKACSLVRILIAHSIINLPNRIIAALEKLEPTSVLDNMFAKVHNVSLPKSFLRNLIRTYPLDTAAVLVKGKSMKTKLEEELKTSVVLHEGEILSPNKFTIELVAKSLESDIRTACSRSSKYHYNT